MPRDSRRGNPMPRHAQHAQRIATIERMRRQGHSDNQIGAVLGISRQRVQQLAAEIPPVFSLPVVKPLPLPRRLDPAIKLYRATKRARETSRDVALRDAAREFEAFYSDAKDWRTARRPKRLELSRQSVVSRHPDRLTPNADAGR